MKDFRRAYEQANKSGALITNFTGYRIISTTINNDSGNLDIAHVNRVKRDEVINTHYYLGMIDAQTVHIGQKCVSRLDFFENGYRYIKKTEETEYYEEVRYVGDVEITRHKYVDKFDEKTLIEEYHNGILKFYKSIDSFGKVETFRS